MSIERAMNGLIGFGAGWVLWLLVMASVVALAIIAERLVVLALSRDDLARLERMMVDTLSRGDVEACCRRLGESPSMEARIAQAALDAPDVGVARARVARETMLARALLERHVEFLGTLGSYAPFVGLLGTVIGIVGAFHELGTAAGVGASQLMVQIGEALVASAVGLLVAIPAILVYRVLLRAIGSRIERADALTEVALAYAYPRRPKGL